MNDSRSAFSAQAIRSFIDRLTASAAFRLLCATLAAQSLMAVLTPVLTRVVTPQDFGIFVPFLSVAGILLPLVSLRYEWAIPIAPDAASVARLTQISAGLLGAVTVAAGAVATILLVTGFPVEVPTSLLLLFAPLLFVMGAVQILSSWVLRAAAFDALAIARVTNATLVISAQIGLALVIDGPLALAIGLIVGQGLAFLPIGRLAWRDVGGGLAASGPSMRQVAHRFRRFPQFSAPSSLINSIGVETPVLLSAALVGPAFTGHLALALRIIGIPGMLASRSLGQTFYAEAARRVREDLPSLRAFYRRAVLRFMIIGVGVLIVGLLCPWAFPLIFGAEWDLAGRIAMWLSIAMFSSISFGTVSCLEYLGRQGLNLVWNSGRLVLVASSMLLSYRVSGDAVTMIASLSLASAAWYPVLYILNEISLRHALKIGKVAGEAA